MGGDQRQPNAVATHSGTRTSRQRPCYLLSVQLLNTYKKINERFYEAKRKQQPGKGVYNDGYDDDQGNYVVQTGEEVAGRYIVQDVLGKGSFGIVVKAHDHRREESVALKIIKNKVQFYQQAKVEIDILTKLNAQAGDEHNIVKLKKVFSWKDHMCLVFELLSFNLYDLLKYTRFHGVSLNLIRKFAVQILRTLSFLAQQSIGIIHCDLKPENVLLRNPKRSAIKVIDFGSSCFVSKRMFKYIQSRFYRAPEVILGLGYDCAIDTWSLACMLVEMHTGQPLFDGKDEAEQLCKFQAILGPLPARMIEQSPKRNNFYQWDAKNKRWILAPVGKDVSRYPRQRLEDIVNNGRRRDQNGHAAEDYTVFLDLVTNMLRYNPKERIVPSDAMQHPFLGPVLQAAQAVQSQSNTSVVSPRRPRCHSAAPTRSGSREPASASRSHSRDQPPATARTRSRDRVGGSGTVSSTMDRKSSSSSVLAGTAGGGGVDRHASLTNLSLGSALGKVVGSHQHGTSLVGGIHAGATHGLPVGVQTAPVGSPLSPSALSLSTTSPRNIHHAGSLPQQPLFNAGAEPMSHAVLADRR